jgi:hypothetical protein
MAKTGELKLFELFYDNWLHLQPVSTFYRLALWAHAAIATCLDISDSRQL